MLLNNFKFWFHKTNESYLTFDAGNKTGRAKAYRVLCPRCDSDKMVKHPESNTGYLVGICENCLTGSEEYFWRVKEVK